MRLAVEADLFCPGATYFDYGCGHGADIDYLQRLGFTSGGWDPHFRPDQPQLPADVVNIGYVINVIEDTAERRQDLLVYLALSQFGQRPKFKHLSPPLQADVKALFGSYPQACTAADLMLISLGQLALLADR